MVPLFTPNKPPKNICILRLSAIGDVCHAVAVVQLIQKYYPTTPITWVVGTVEARLIHDLPGVNVVTFDKNAGLRGYWQLYRELRNTHFDILLHMQVSIRASFASRCIRAKQRLGFDKARAKDLQWLFCNRQIAAQDEPHVLEGFIGFVKMLGIEDEQLQWEVPLSQADVRFAKDQINQAPTLIINPASSVSNRNWHSQGYAEVARYATESLGLQVILTGGPSEKERVLADEIIQKANISIKNLVGKTSLKQLLALLAEAKVVLAPDTGPAHMATMVGTPVIGLYANTNPKRACAYRSKQWVVSSYEQAMQRTYDTSAKALKFGKRAHDPMNMQLIDADRVKATLKQLVA